jgi:hypothetical protein
MGGRLFCLDRGMEILQRCDITARDSKDTDAKRLRERGCPKSPVRETRGHITH